MSSHRVMLLRLCDWACYEFRRIMVCYLTRKLSLTLYTLPHITPHTGNSLLVILSPCPLSLPSLPVFLQQEQQQQQLYAAAPSSSPLHHGPVTPFFFAISYSVVHLLLTVFTIPLLIFRHFVCAYTILCSIILLILYVVG